MGTAALVLGIISLVISFVPLCGIIAVLPAIVGILLGIIDIILKIRSKQSKGVTITGIILSFLSIVVMILWFVIIGFALTSGKIQEKFEKIGEEIQLEINNEFKNQN